MKRGIVVFHIYEYNIDSNTQMLVGSSEEFFDDGLPEDNYWLMVDRTEKAYSGKTVVLNNVISLD